MKFGKFSDLTVFEILNVFKNSEYLRWCYYNMSHISFMPDILQQIEVVQEISKPGKSPELFNNDIIEYKILSVEQASYYKSLGERKKKRLEIKSDKNSKSSKEFLMNKNRNKLS